jgi:calnexin
VDEPKFVADPDARKPKDWDDEILGNWEPPMIANPKCEFAMGCGVFEAPAIRNPEFKGKWKAPQIPNPDYVGKWKPRQIENPEYREDLHPHNFEALAGAGFELWLVGKDVGYANVYIGNNEEAVLRWNEMHFIPKRDHQIEREKRTRKAVREGEGEGGETVGFWVRLGEFGGTLGNAWGILYEANSVMTIGGSIAIVVVPFGMCWLVCRRGRRSRKERLRKKKSLGKDGGGEKEGNREMK